jgi:predicted permease
MSEITNDLRFAMRQLRRSPGFALTAVLTLALGIGANAAVFTLFDQVLLRMLPVEKPKELVRFVWSGSYSGSASSFGGDTNNYFSYPMYKDLRDRNQVFDGMLAAVRTTAGLSWQNQAENEDAEVVSGNYFQLLGLKPALGRLLIPQDDTVQNGNPVVVLGYDYWRTRFAGSRDVVGQTLLVNGTPFTILGVAPESFRSAIPGYKPGVFLPISMVDVVMPWMTPRDDLHSHKSIWLTLVARLKPGVTIPQAQASLAPLWHGLRADEMQYYKSASERFRKGFVDNSHLEVVDDSAGFSPDRMDLKTPLIILMSMAVVLVAICCINVATLLLLRAAGRAREMSMRYALGAKRGRIISQLLVEGGVLGVTGAVIGLAIAPGVTQTLVRIMTNSDPGAEPYSAAIDVRVLLFTMGVSLLSSLLFSVAPVLHFMRPDLATTLRQSAGTASKNTQLFRKLAVGVQIALSVVLLGGAGLFVRTLDHLRQQQVGFETSNLVTFGMDPTTSGYDGGRTPQAIATALQTIRQLPGVTNVAATTDAELSGDSSGSDFSVQGYKVADDEALHFEQPRITAGYFATLHQPLLAGREFTDADAKDAPKVAVVNLTFAKKFYGSAQNALGRMLGENSADKPADITIVGVVGVAKHTDLRTDMVAAVYMPYMQMLHPRGVQIYARTAQAPETVEAEIRQAVHAMDPTLVVNGMRTMQAQIDISASQERALAILAMGFAALALILAAVGLYGVLAYSTESRTREIGVRLALGSSRGGVVTLVVREMAIIAAVAIALALPAIVALAKLFRSQLYGVTTADPMALAAAVILPACMVVLAAALPARRAASTDPAQALRTE